MGGKSSGVEKWLFIFVRTMSSVADPLVGRLTSYFSLKLFCRSRAENVLLVLFIN